PGPSPKRGGEDVVFLPSPLRGGAGGGVIETARGSPIGSPSRHQAALLKPGRRTNQPDLLARPANASTGERGAPGGPVRARGRFHISAYGPGRPATLESARPRH